MISKIVMPRLFRHEPPHPPPTKIVVPQSESRDATICVVFDCLWKGLQDQEALEEHGLNFLASLVHRQPKIVLNDDRRDNV